MSLCVLNHSSLCSVRLFKSSYPLTQTALRSDRAQPDLHLFAQAQLFHMAAETNNAEAIDNILNHVKNTTVHANLPQILLLSPYNTRCIHTHTHTHTRARARAHTHTHTRAHTSTHTFTGSGISMAGTNAITNTAPEHRAETS